MAGYRKCRMCEKKMKQMMIDDAIMEESMMKPMMMMKNMENMMHTMQLIMDQMMPMEDTSSMM